jgi:hypothetical protein
LGARGKTSRRDATEYDAFRKWKAYERQKVEKEAEKALKVADIVCEPAEIIPAEQDPNKKHNPRRRLRRAEWVREPINGYSAKHSDIARHVMGLKLAGEVMREAFASAASKFEISPVTVERLYYDKVELFDLAEQECITNGMKEYHQNLWICRTALSQAGPLAVQTLMDILEDPDATDSVRSKSAVAVLKMLDVDGSNNANPSEKIALEGLKLVREVTLTKMKGEESHIVEAEDAEIVEEDASEPRVDDQLL